MAQSSKNKTTANGKSRKSSAGRSGTASKRQETYEEEELPAFLGPEVMIILSFLLAVLLFLSNFHLCGVVGDFLRRLQLGLFGVTGYVLPFFLFIGTSFYMANRGNKKAVIKLLAVTGGLLAVCGLAQMMFGAALEPGGSLLDFYQLSSEGKGGGLLGGVISFGFRSVVGTIGAYLILLAVLIICGVCITEKSVVNVVKSSSGKAYQYAKEDAIRRREEREERMEEKRRLREDKVVRGVDFGSITFQEQPAAPVPGMEDGKGQGQTGQTGQPGGKAASREKVSSRSSGKAKEQPAEASSYSSADVFTGKIDIPPEYEEPVPFVEDVKPIVLEDAPKPAPEEEKVLSFGKKSGKKKDGPLYADRELMTMEELDDTLPVPTLPGEELEEVSAERAAFSAFGQESANLRQDGQAEIGYSSHEPAGQTFSGPASQTEPPSFVPTSGEADPDLDGSITFEEEPSDEVEWDFFAEDKPEEPDDFSVPIPEEEEDSFSSVPWDERKETGQGRDRFEEAAGKEQSIFVPEESKRVVTATGKIIETETELLQKRIETRREEAAAERPEAALRAAEKKPEPVKKPYVFPPTSLLKKGNRTAGGFSEQEYKETAIKLQQTLRNFGVGVTVTNISCGPSVTRYELHPDQGVKVSRIVGLADDIKLSLAAAEIRIEAPIPGKSAVGIEVPNKETSMVYLRELLEADGFVNSKSKLTFAVGKDIAGQPVTADIGKMPHLLIAGATGSGKSVCINTLIMSIIFKADPDEVKLIMVDPKVVELSVYNGIPHLMIPVVTDPKKASGALNWAVAEMGDRYKKFAEYNVRDLKGYNEKIKNLQGIPEESRPKTMPQIVIIIDELADLMMVVPGEVEDAICRLAQLARAAGIHLVIATQRPSVNVITGLIKANVPSRIAFSVSSGVDSRTIIDMNGAEKLLGKGDMLFYPSGMPKPQRVQGAFVSDQEVSQVVEFLTDQGLTASYSSEVEHKVMNGAPDAFGGGDNSRDEYFGQAGRFIIEKEKASIGMLQRMFKIGFNRAARIMDQLADAGVVGEEEGTKPRKVLMTIEEFEQLLSGGSE